MTDQKVINKDLILRERLALQRTVLANQYFFSFFTNCNVFFNCRFKFEKSIKNRE